MILKDKVAVVTGGTRGIGAATALALAKEGASVAIVGRGKDADCEATMEGLSRLRARHKLILADCGKQSDCARCIQETEAELGGVDIVVHAAGGPVNGGLFELNPDTWQSAFDVHVHAIFHLCRAAVPGMRKRREGAVILVSSTAGLRGIITNVAYQVAKGALPQFARALAREFANDNIRINCVAPGVVRTRFHETMSAEQKRLNLEQRIPLHREGTPEQVAEVILMLIRNDYITGETVTIDGGLTMRIA